MSCDVKWCTIRSGQEGTVKKYTVQAMNNEDRQMWMNVMEGKEPVRTLSLCVVGSFRTLLVGTF